MKLKQGFNLRNICGEYILIAEGIENIDFTSVINMNETAAYLWKSLQEKDFAVEDMVKLILKEYEIDEDTAYADCKKLSDQWKEAKICE